VARDWERTLRAWSKPADDKQEEKADRTASEVRDALSEYPGIPNSAMHVFPQGSKRNNTDLPGECDVDVGVELQQGSRTQSATPPVFYAGIATSASGWLTRSMLGLADVPLIKTPAEFKRHVANAMVAAFGEDKVVWHDKCIKVNSTRLTIPADLVPCYPYRLYTSATTFEQGIIIYPDSGGQTVNYPEQHYRNGVAKNNQTGTRFKKMVRCLKRMESELVAVRRVPQVPSFLMESLVYNCPTACFSEETYVNNLLAVLARIHHGMTNGLWRDWVEVNGIKSLFLDGQTWTPSQCEQLAIVAFGIVHSATRAAS
jgi:hypothetical protein